MEEALNENSTIKPPYILLKEALQATRFYFYKPDNELVLTSEVVSLIQTVTKAFYMKRTLKASGLSLFKKRNFLRDYKAHPEKYPPLLSGESIAFLNFSDAVPGEPIDYNMFICYFKDVKTTEGKPFLNYFGKSMEPFAGMIELIRTELEKMIGMLSAGYMSHSERLEQLQGHYQDIKHLVALCQYIGTLYTYSKNAKLAPLKTGHLIAIVSGLHYYFAELTRFFTELGLVLVNFDSLPPLLLLIDKLTESIRYATVSFIIDIITPALFTIDFRLEVRDEQVRLIDDSPIDNNIFNKILDTILNFFLPKRKADTETIQIMQKREKLRVLKEKAEKKLNAQTPDSPNFNPEMKVIEENKESDFNSAPFLEMQVLLGEFIKMLLSDLAPETKPSGEVINYKQGFDQFNVSSRQRYAKVGAHILNGKLTNIGSEIGFSDQIIINSTYWIYDRIQFILKTYPIPQNGVSLELARDFIEEIHSLYFPSKTEFNETKRHANFPQFKINLRRLFSTNALQTRYIEIIEKISKLMDKTRPMIIRETANRETRAKNKITK